MRAHAESLQVVFIQHLDTDVPEPAKLGPGPIDERLRINDIGRLGAHVAREVDSIGKVSEIVCILAFRAVIAHQTDDRQHCPVYAFFLESIETIAAKLVAECNSRSRRLRIRNVIGPQNLHRAAFGVFQQGGCGSAEILGDNASNGSGANANEVNARIRCNAIQRQ